MSKDAMNWLNSATKNFHRIQSTRHSGSACWQIEHYTDVVAEATAASALVPVGSAIHKKASNLQREATDAQRQATRSCRRELHKGTTMTTTRL
jgi:hypothetical protein